MQNAPYNTVDRTLRLKFDLWGKSPLLGESNRLKKIRNSLQINKSADRTSQSVGIFRWEVALSRCFGGEETVYK